MLHTRLVKRVVTEVEETTVEFHSDSSDPEVLNDLATQAADATDDWETTSSNTEYQVE